MKKNEKQELLTIIRRFKNHAEIFSGYPSKSFRKKIIKLLKKENV